CRFLRGLHAGARRGWFRRLGGGGAGAHGWGWNGRRAHGTSRSAAAETAWGGHVVPPIALTTISAAAQIADPPAASTGECDPVGGGDGPRTKGERGLVPRVVGRGLDVLGGAGGLAPGAV